MNSKIKEIDEFINNHISDETGEIVEADDFANIEGLIKYANKKFGCNIEIQCAGSYDNPGFSMDCYAWAGVIDGELYFRTLQIERD